MSTSTIRLLTGAAALALAAGGALTAPPAHAITTRTCSNADLTASYHHSDDGAGHSFGFIVLRNTSERACRLGGYGGVSYVGDGNGTQIGAPAVRTDSADLAVYVLQHGQRLRSPISEANAGDFGQHRCRPAHVDGFRVYVPNSPVSQFVVHPTTGCRNHAVTLITQKPYRRP